jgi:hypothetical protein
LVFSPFHSTRAFISSIHLSFGLFILLIFFCGPCDEDEGQQIDIQTNTLDPQKLYTRSCPSEDVIARRPRQVLCNMAERSARSELVAVFGKGLCPTKDRGPWVDRELSDDDDTCYHH